MVSIHLRIRPQHHAQVRQRVLDIRGRNAYGGEYLISGRFNSKLILLPGGQRFYRAWGEFELGNPGQFVVATDTSWPMGISMAGSQIHQLTDGWTYMADGSSSVWCDDKSGTAFVDYVAFGVDWGFGYGGTFRRPKRAGYTKTAISLPQGHAGTGGRRIKPRCWSRKAATRPRATPTWAFIA